MLNDSHKLSRVTGSKRSLPIWVALVISGIAGVLVAAQSRINGGLSQQIDNGYLASAVSFGSGLIIITIAIVISRRGRIGLQKVHREVSSRHLPWWALTGGLCGTLFVLGQSLVVTAIGVALFTVAIVAGQVFGGLVLDRIGVGPGGRVTPSVQRVIGTILAIFAVALTVFADFFGPDSVASHVWLMVVPVILGLGVAWQSAVNGLVRSAAHSALTATFINFVVGTSVLLVFALISVGVNGWPTAWPHEPVFYVGGLVGVIFIGTAAVLVRTAGVLLLSMSNVTGQLIAAVAFDAGVPIAGSVTPAMLVGAVVALIAVLIAALPGRRTSHR